MEGVDLFGNPIRPGRGAKGRPRFEATEADRNKVSLLLAYGWSNERVANGVGISPATLKRYFRAELREREKMRDRLDAKRLMIAFEAASAGNVGALKELGRMIERNDAALDEARLRQAQAARRREATEGDAPESQPRKGKKEQALEAAQGVLDGTEWGDDLAWGGRVQ